MLTIAVVGGCEVRKHGEDGVRETESEVGVPLVSEETAADEVPMPDPDDDRTVAQRIQDASIAARVKVALAEERPLRLLDFEPEVHEGVVYLDGDVPSVTHFTLAEQVARRVEGVRDVENRLAAPDMDPVQQPPVDTADASITARDTAAAPPVPAEAPATPSTPSEEQYHTVVSGESLWEIARSNDTSVEQLRRLNNLQGDRLRVGQRLRVR